MVKIKILLIDDDKSSNMLLAELVKKEGFEVLTAEDGESGLTIFNTENPEIVITDLKMNEIDGMELMHTIKKLSPITQIILVTAFGDQDTAIFALREGALAYLSKPFDFDMLVRTLDKAREKVIANSNAIPFPVLLLADDDESTRKRFARVLAKEKWEILQANDGEEALTIFKKTRIDIALLDIKMPKIDGLTLLHEMKSIRDDFKAIILTGHRDETDVIRAIDEGAINFFKKPIDLDMLITSVEKSIAILNSERSLKYSLLELKSSNSVVESVE